jgi:hypothetical protein
VRGVGDLLQVIEEAEDAACGWRRAKEVDREGRQIVGNHEQME